MRTVTQSLALAHMLSYKTYSTVHRFLDPGSVYTVHVFRSVLLLIHSQRQQDEQQDLHTGR